MADSAESRFGFALFSVCSAMQRLFQAVKS
jgi:hypothetical protein